MDERSMQHGRHWTGRNVRGWFVTEKFRGARAYWDGAALWSRGGLRIPLPDEWAASLPAGIALDGEVWAARGPANGPAEIEAAAAVTHGTFTRRLRYIVFDAPGVVASWPARLAVAAANLPTSGVAQVVGWDRLRSLPHLDELFAAVISRGGEGLMLYEPAARYEPRRTGALLKVKIDPALRLGRVRFPVAA